MGISTHILDTAAGKPAAGVTVVLYRLSETISHQLSQATTDADGRIQSLLPEAVLLEPGNYKVHFDTAAYYATQKQTGLYPFVEITFAVTAGQQHYHIPLLLTANGYTTYRGS